MEVDRPENLQALAEAQHQASSTIYGSNDPATILDALINFGGKQFASARLGLLVPESEPPILNIIAQWSGERTQTVNLRQALTDFPAHETFAAVEVLDVPDVTTDPFLTENERELLRKQKIGALMVIPLVVNQRLTGAVIFSNPQALPTDESKLRAFRSLADQVAVVFENQALLRRTEISLHETQQLYVINRAMLGALDPLDVLRVLREHLAPDAASILHAVVEHLPDSSAERLSIRHVITPTDEQVVDTAVTSVRRASDLFAVSPETSVEFVENVKQAESKRVIDALIRRAVGSYIVIAVRERGRIEDIIVITFADERTFDGTARRLFAATADPLSIVMQNQRLLREAQTSAIQLSRQVRVLQTINRLSSGISSFQSERELLDYTMQAMNSAVGVDHTAIAVIEPSGEYSIVTSEYPKQIALGARIGMKNNPLKDRVVREGNKPIIRNDLENDTEMPANERDVLLGLGVFSLMIIPVIVYDELIGTIGFDIYQRGRTFTQEMVEIGQTMTNQLGIALQNIRLLTETQHRANQLERITQFSQAMQATLELDTILNIMLAESTQLLPTDSMSVALYDARSGRLRVAAHFEDERTTIDLRGGALISMEGSYAGRVWQTRELLFIPDTQQRADAGDLSTRALIIAPIRSRGRLLGTVSIGSLRAHAYSEGDAVVFQQMVNQLAVAIENAEAFAQSQRMAQNEALINEISASIQEQRDIETMLSIAVGELGRALGAQQARGLLQPQLDDAVTEQLDR